MRRDTLPTAQRVISTTWIQLEKPDHRPKREIAGTVANFLDQLEPVAEQAGSNDGLLLP